MDASEHWIVIISPESIGHEFWHSARPTKSPRRAASVVWARCTGPATRSSTADVALTVLPDSFAATERLARFDRIANGGLYALSFRKLSKGRL